MEGEDTTVVETVTDAPDSPQGGTEETVDYRKRFEDTQAWGTQQAQEAARYRTELEELKTDEDKQRQFLTDLGYLIEDPEDDPPADEIEALKREFEARFAKVEQHTSQAEQDRQVRAIEAHFEQAAKGHDLDDEEKALVVGRALTMQPGTDGLPPFEDAINELEAVWTARQAKWANTKKTPHRVSPSGVAGAAKPDLSTAQAKTDFIMSRLAEDQ